MNIALTAPVPVLSACETRRAQAPFVPFRAISLRTAAWSVLLGVGVITPVALGLGLLPLPVDPASLAGAQRRFLDYVMRPEALFVKAVLVAPLLEELVFRGLILQLLRRYGPVWLAVGVSAGVFGLTHIAHGCSAVLNACLLGGLFSWLTVHTRSLLPSMMCHAAVNFSWLFLITPAFGLVQGLLDADPRNLAAMPGGFQLFPAWWVLVSTALAIGAFVVLRRHARFQTKE